MAVTIRNKPTNQNREEHPIYEYYGFIDSEGDFFLITESDTIVLMDDRFPTYNLSCGHNSIEEFLESEFNTTLVRAYKQNDFDITIDLKYREHMFPYFFIPTLYHFNVLKCRYTLTL